MIYDVFFSRTYERKIVVVDWVEALNAVISYRRAPWTLQNITCNILITAIIIVVTSVTRFNSDIQVHRKNL